MLGGVRLRYIRSGVLVNISGLETQDEGLSAWQKGWASRAPADMRVRVIELECEVSGRSINYVMDTGDGYVKMKRTGFRNTRDAWRIVSG